MKRPQTIFYGNGLSRLSEGCPSWSDLLASVNENPDKCADFEKIPFTFQYEVLLPGDFYTRRVIKPRGGTSRSTYTVPEQMELAVKGRIRERLQAIGGNPLYERLARLDVCNFITTNYDYVLHDTFVQQCGCILEKHGRERRYSIRRRAGIFRDGQPLCNIWSIHGETDNLNSMMLGLDHYGEAAARIEEYVKGKAGGQHVGYDSIEKRLARGLSDDGGSWIDLFFSTDIHITGFGFDLSESDCWWLLNRRARLLRKLAGQVEANQICFYGQPDAIKAHLLRKMGVDVIEVQVAGNDYGNQYGQILSMLEKAVGVRD